MVAHQIDCSERERSDSDNDDNSITSFFGSRARSSRSDYSSPHTTIVTTPHDAFIESANYEIGEGKIFVSSDFISPILHMIHVDTVIMNKTLYERSAAI